MSSIEPRKHEGTKTRKPFCTGVLFVCFVFSCFRVFVVTVHAESSLQNRLSEIASHVDGTVGYSVLDLTTGDRFGVRRDEAFPAASTIKIAIVYELFKQAEEHRVRLDERVTLNRSKAVGGSGVLFYMGTPTMTIVDYAALMVMVSDNTATNVLIDRLGMENVTRRMLGLGLKNTKLRRHMMDTAAARRGEDNVSTPDDLVTLLQIMNRDRPDGIALLKKPKENRLRRGLPPGVESADKSGELDGVRNDAGIVYAKDRPYVLCVMTQSLKSEAEGERAIEAMSRAAYEYFSASRTGPLP